MRKALRCELTGLLLREGLGASVIAQTLYQWPVPVADKDGGDLV